MTRPALDSFLQELLSPGGQGSSTQRIDDSSDPTKGPVHRNSSSLPNMNISVVVDNAKGTKVDYSSFRRPLSGNTMSSSAGPSKNPIVDALVDPMSATGISSAGNNHTNGDKKNSRWNSEPLQTDATPILFRRRVPSLDNSVSSDEDGNSNSSTEDNLLSLSSPFEQPSKSSTTVTLKSDEGNSHSTMAKDETMTLGTCSPDIAYSVNEAIRISRSSDF